jgi:hypothetical protein
MVMMFDLPCHDELTRTMGPGSRKRRTLPTGKSRFEYLFMPITASYWDSSPIRIVAWQKIRRYSTANSWLNRPQAVHNGIVTKRASAPRRE